MVISSDRSNIVRSISLMVLVILVTLLFALCMGIIPALVFLLFSTVIIALHYVAIGRTIIMDKNGCKITLWKYSKEYTWNEISIKRLEPPHLGLRQSYHHGGAFFSIRPIRKPTWLDPALYCTFFHPLSCFFVYFVGQGAFENAATSQGVYEVNKQEFLKQLQLWDIILDE